MGFIYSPGLNDVLQGIGAVSDTSFHGIAINIEDVNLCGAFHLVQDSGGTLVATWRFRVSNDYNSGLRMGAPKKDGTTTPAATFLDVSAKFLDASTGVVPATTLPAGGSFVPIPTNFLGAKVIEVGFTPASGSGTMHAFFVGKGT